MPPSYCWQLVVLLPILKAQFAPKSTKLKNDRKKSAVRASLTVRWLILIRIKGYYLPLPSQEKRVRDRIIELFEKELLNFRTGG